MTVRSCVPDPLDRIKELEGVLRSLEADIEAMQASPEAFKTMSDTWAKKLAPDEEMGAYKDDWFGPFATWEHDGGDSVMIEWPCLSILLAKVKEVL